MNEIIRKLLAGKGENHILPFFWQHGEDEATLRKYMAVIHNAGIGAVCVESRPHPDFCGPLWWRDMDIILDEARARQMKVWILDDSHFPTGYANGALKNAPNELCRQSIVCRTLDCAQKTKLKLGNRLLAHPLPSKKTIIELAVSLRNRKKERKFDDDRLLGVYALRLDSAAQAEILDLTGQARQSAFEWRIPEGKWRVYVLHLSRNFGPHRDYINMMDPASCRVLLNAVYEPHYAHYKADFGTTIAGFFSDEPELGNGHLYQFGLTLGMPQDLPWSLPLETVLQQSLGADFARRLPLLWENGADAELTARTRYAYMDAVTRLVETSFSQQVGEWCSARGVEYIGHVIEDNNQHARTGSSLGHFFRGLSGQHMAGVDVVTRQILPHGEVQPAQGPLGAYDDEFYHFALAKLGSSHAAIDPLKQGRAMCEIFGNYGWSEGLRIEKYLADHFLVRGINHYVPHAFSPKAYPDPDCPPHFYAHGHNPQYRHFGCLMRYMNRVCALISGGQAVTPVAILYHGEAEWTGSCMLMQKPARVLAERQIDYDFIPADVFTETKRYATELETGLCINGKRYKALVIPTAEFVSADFARAAGKLQRMGFPVLFIEALPKGLYDGEPALEAATLSEIAGCSAIPLARLVEVLAGQGIAEITLTPASRDLRCLHYRHGSDLFLLVNEAASTYSGKITLPAAGSAYAYNAWDNRIEALDAAPVAAETQLAIEIEPYKSLIVVFDEAQPAELAQALRATGCELSLPAAWRRSLCTSLAYPHFGAAQPVSLPDNLAKDQPKFSGFVRYENEFGLERVPATAVLEISDAWEGVEVFVNGISAGIQIVPTFRFDITALLQPGKNQLAIEVASTLERERAAGRRSLMERLQARKLKDPTGITGLVKLYAT